MRFLLFVCFFALPGPCFGKDGKITMLSERSLRVAIKGDTVVKRKSATDSLKHNASKHSTSARDTDKLALQPSKLSMFPATSLQQLLKGRASGAYFPEPSGEPGTVQNIFIRGTSVPLLSAKDVYQTQPTVVIDGIPVISQDHPFAYDIQQYDFNRIGPATNLLAGIDPANIESIEVLKDLSESAKYGPRAANGIIYITSKRPTSQKRISFDTYFGLATHDAVTTLNAASESAFRKPFYDKYATIDQKQNIVPYLRDSLYNIYYGPSNWTDLYYRNALVYGLNIGVSGGTRNASFRTSFGSLRNNGVADATGLSRYNASMALDMKPATWLNFTVSFDATQMLRDRNKYLRDRFAEVRYLPDLTNPISPNKDYYANYLAQYDKSFDKNKSNNVDAYFDTRLTFGKFKFDSRFAIDYREGYRDIFYPSTLLETNSYVSNYFGFNQRAIVDNTVSYNLDWNKTHFLDLEAGQSAQWDSYRYNYGYAYRGTSDYIKINVFDDPIHPTLATFSYNTTLGFLTTLTYRYIDQTKSVLESFYSKATYRYKDKYSLSLMLRSDGSSNQQPTSRWFYSPIISGTWNIKNDLLADKNTISELNLKASYGRVGRLQQDDHYAVGPQYTVDIGYTGEPRLGSYYGVAPINRPYSTGWVGYNIPWAYTEQLNAGVDIGILNNRLRAAVDLYSRTDNNELISVPAYAEYGYMSAIVPGMKINNSGIDADVSAEILPRTHGLQWTSSVNFNFNHNVLKALPGGLDQVIIGTRLLQVGQAADQYWIYQNQGIYNSASEIPVNPKTGLAQTFQGIQLQAGDPKWADVNGDYVIDNKDKVLKGHILPVISGGFTNDFGYKNWGLNINMYYNLGRSIVNQDMANRFDFINRQSGNNINAVKEVTFWEKRGDYSKYPIYNPWSPVTPYRTDQDLFLENASFLKMRSVSLSYDLTSKVKNKFKINRMLVYTTVSNVFTITPYTGRDPELVDYTGYDTGYGQPIPRTYTIGVKMDL